MKSLKLLLIAVTFLSLNACVTGTASNVVRGVYAVSIAVSDQDARAEKQRRIDRQNAQHRTFQLRAMQDQLNQPD